MIIFALYKSTEMKEQEIEEFNDVEKEEGNENVDINVPFNPSKINIKIVPYTIGQLVDRLEYGEIAIPSYQRIPNLWNDRKKSRFIESLMLNLPIPLFYFDNQDDNIWRVVDGLQRVSTIEHFIVEKKDKLSKTLNPLQLVDLEFLKEYNGKYWNDLPRDMQRRINSFQITINLIDKGTPDEVKYNIFSRINQGGEPLKPQEIRTALFQGFRANLLEEMVSTENEIGKSFHKAVTNSVKKARQDDLDFANRFLAFYQLGYEIYQPDMDTFLTKGLESLQNDEVLLNKAKSDFKKAMDLAIYIFVDDAFRKRTNKSDARKPINKPLFEVISLYFSKLNPEQIKNLKDNKKTFVEALIKLQKNDNDKAFMNAISYGTATRESVFRRHSIFYNLLKPFI